MRYRSLLLAIFLVFISLTISSYTDVNGDFQRRGIEKLELGNYNGAIVDFSKAIEIDPNDAVTYDYRGVAKANEQERRKRTFRCALLLYCLPGNACL